MILAKVILKPSIKAKVQLKPSIKAQVHISRGLIGPRGEKGDTGAKGSDAENINTIIDEDKSQTISGNRQFIIPFNFTNNGVFTIGNSAYFVIGQNFINNGNCQLEGTLLVANAVLGTGPITGTGNLI